MTTTPDAIGAAHFVGAVELVTIDGYTKRHGITERTLRRWLAADELPGARLIDGAWAIPINATRTPAAKGAVVQMTPDMAPDMAPVVSYARITPPTAAELVDALPGYVELDVAAQLLGIPEGAIRRNRDHFQLQPFGAHGALVMPRHRIKEILG